MSRSINASLGLAALLVGGCAAEPEPAVRTAPAFDPIAFFAGRTEGRGTVAVVLRNEQPLSVQGAGRVAADGGLTLDQIVRRGDRAPERRQWKMRQVAPGRYSGTLSDAVGPVEVVTRGTLLTIRFPMKGGFAAEQSLFLAADGRSALNRMRVRKFGVTVARIDETIRKLD